MICGSCGNEARRVRTLFEVDGKPLPIPLDECEFCAHGGQHFDPDWMRHKPVPLWESRPWLYTRKQNPDGGWMYVPTDENLADLEAQVCAPASDDVQAEQEAKEKKRATRRTEPLTGEELSRALARANRIATECVEAYKNQ